MKGEKGRKGEEEKRKPVRMAKNFNFEMLAIYVMLKLTVKVASATTATNFS